MPQEGMLVQIDGSHHRWLEERGPWLTLLLSVDDATGSVPFALFQEQEDTDGYFRLIRGIIQQKGIPLALYSDRYFVFRYNGKKEDTSDKDPLKRNPTQFGRAMRELVLQQHLGCDRLKGGNEVEVLRWILGYAKQVYQG
jgi:hypothetical protein